MEVDKVKTANKGESGAEMPDGSHDDGVCWPDKRSAIGQGGQNVGGRSETIRLSKNPGALA